MRVSIHQGWWGGVSPVLRIAVALSGTPASTFVADWTRPPGPNRAATGGLLGPLNRPPLTGRLIDALIGPLIGPLTGPLIGPIGCLIGPLMCPIIRTLTGALIGPLIGPRIDPLIGALIGPLIDPTPCLVKRREKGIVVCVPEPH